MRSNCLNRMSLGAVVACTLAAISGQALGQTARFIPLGVLDDRLRTPASYAHGVSALGGYVVGGSFVDGGFGNATMRACRWRVTRAGILSGPEALETDLNFGTLAVAVSVDGERIVGSAGLLWEFFYGFDYFPYHGFYWWDLSSAPQSGLIGETLEFTDITADGGAAVGTTRDPMQFDPIPADAFRWTGPASTVEHIGTLGGQSIAYATSADGAVIAGASGNSGGTINSFVWDGIGGVQPLGAFPDTEWNSAFAVSADGGTIAGSTNGDSFVTTGGVTTMVTRFPDAGWSIANDVTDGGTLVVGHTVNDTPDGFLYRAFVWDSTNGMRHLADWLGAEHGIDTTGWTFKSISAVSDDGRSLTGWGVNPAGFTEGFVIQLCDGTCLCPSDVNEDGFSDAIDYDAFIAAWLTTDKSADFNGDGFVDAIDYDLFLSRWIAGC